MRRLRAITAMLLATTLSAVLLAVPVAAQEDYQSALESGDLVSLIPESFADGEMMDGMTFALLLGPQQMDTPDSAAAREELTALLESAGVTPDDAMSISGFAGDQAAFTTFSALRVPGLGATDWFEPFYRITLFRNFSDPTRETITVGPKQVLRIADPGSSRSDLLYAQGEVLWTLSGDDDLGIAFIDALETVDGAVLSGDPGAPADGEPVAAIGTAADPLSQIPDAILGAETQTQTFPGEAMFQNVDPEDAESVAVVDAFKAVLDGVGGIDQATIIASQARGPDGDGVQVIGLHVDGADHADFADGFVDVYLMSTYDDPQLEETQLGGKTVQRVTDAGRLAGSTAYIYNVGGTSWIMLGDEGFITALLRTMP